MSVFKFIYFNWRIITLQYCDGFCHTSTLAGRRYTCVPPSGTPSPTYLPTHPSGLSQGPGPGSPALCTELALVIHSTYGNVYVSILFSQIVPRSPPTVQKSVLYVYVSFTALYVGSLVPSFYISHICVNI